MPRRLLPSLLLPTLLACGTPEVPPVTPTNEPAPASPTASAAAAPAPSAEPTPAPVPALTTLTACAASPPFTLQPSVPNASSPVSAVLTGDTLWVFHMGGGKSGGTPELLEVAGAASPSRKVTAHALPSGNIGSRSALAAYQGGVIGTFVGDAGVVFFHKPAKGDLKVVTAKAAGVTSMGSVALVGSRALVSFGEDEWGVHVGWFDVAAMRADGPLVKIGGSVQQSAVAETFGGVVFFSEATKDSAPMELRARLASGGASFALPAIGGDNGSAASATGGGGRAFVIYNVIGAATPGMMFPSSIVKIATLTDEKGNGKTVSLGPSGMVPELAIQRTSWGAMAAFSGRTGAANAAFVNDQGALVGSPIPVSEDGERVRQPAVAAGDRAGYVVWNQMGTAALRVAPLSCQ